MPMIKNFEFCFQGRQRDVTLALTHLKLYRHSLYRQTRLRRD